VIVSGVSALLYDDSAGFTAPPAFGTFRVLHQIGSGALGPVFRAYEPQRERLIAVKAFRLDIVPEVTTRLAEALRRLAAVRVESPCIVPTVAAGLEGLTAFLGSEYDTSETFDAALRRLAPAPIDRARPILRQVAEAIEAGWAAGLGHGALHPRDVFVSDTNQVRVTGFGVVPALEALGITAPVRRPYTAPERVAGRPWDIRADVYSFGVLAHELLTGRRPAGTGEQDWTLPTGTTPAQRVAIRAALACVLAEDPANRYATPSEFLAALETEKLPSVTKEVVEVVAVPTPPTPPAPPAVDVAPSTPARPAAGAPTSPTSPSVARPTPARPPAPTRPAVARSIPAGPTVPPPALPFSSGIAAAFFVVGVLIGAALGYVWRGPSGSAPDALETAAVVGDVPVGTDVAVTEPPTVPAETTPSGEVAQAEPSATRGRLLVRSVPAGARVMISGRARGTTPATVRDLPFGTYNVTVSREGYRPRIARVTLSRTVPARDITVELRRAAPLAPAASTGSLYIDTRPSGAQVTIDGRLMGTTPMRVPDVAPGSHTIRLDLAGHKSMTTTVVVRAGQQVPVRVSLEVM